MTQGADHGTPKALGQRFDGKQVVWAGALPGMRVGIPGAAGDEAVQVDVLPQGLTPGVEDGNDPQLTI